MLLTEQIIFEVQKIFLRMLGDLSEPIKIELPNK